jgi:hypothetical protein
MLLPKPVFAISKASPNPKTKRRRHRTCCSFGSFPCNNLRIHAVSTSFCRSTQFASLASSIARRKYILSMPSEPELEMNSISSSMVRLSTLILLMSDVLGPATTFSVWVCCIRCLSTHVFRTDFAVPGIFTRQDGMSQWYLI